MSTLTSEIHVHVTKKSSNDNSNNGGRYIGKNSSEKSASTSIKQLSKLVTAHGLIETTASVSSRISQSKTIDKMWSDVKYGANIVMLATINPYVAGAKVVLDLAQKSFNHYMDTKDYQINEQYYDMTRGYNIKKGGR